MSFYCDGVASRVALARLRSRRSNVRSWHLADMLSGSLDVLGQSGHRVTL